MFKNKMVAGLVLACLALGAGVGLQGCIQQSETEVGVVVPHVESVAAAAKSLAGLANSFYLSDEDCAAISEVMTYVADNTDKADGSLSQFMLNAVESSISAGKVPESFRFLLVGMVNLMNDYFAVRDFNVDDFVVITRAFVAGLETGDVSAKSVDELNF